MKSLRKWIAEGADRVSFMASGAEWRFVEPMTRGNVGGGILEFRHPRKFPYMKALEGFIDELTRDSRRYVHTHVDGVGASSSERNVSEFVANGSLESRRSLHLNVHDHDPAYGNHETAWKLIATVRMTQRTKFSRASTEIEFSGPTDEAKRFASVLTRYTEPLSSHEIRHMSPLVEPIDAQADSLNRVQSQLAWKARWAGAAAGLVTGLIPNAVEFAVSVFK